MNANQTWNCDDEISEKKRKSGVVKAKDKEKR